VRNLEVRIVGDGPERGEFMEVYRELGLGETVRWLGDVSAADLAAEYNRCDVFCLPSVQEGFGIVFLEAMAAGKPIVAARASAVPEVVTQGLLTEPENAESLAAAIQKLHGDRALCHSLGEAGLRSVAQYDTPRVARLFLYTISGAASRCRR
jgi:glycosyltransferase involved in cell wall biosynthesis